MRQGEEAHEQDRADDEQTYVLGDAARKRARVLDAPDKIETVLHFLDRAHERPQEHRKTQGSHHPGAHAMHEMHHAGGDLSRARLTHGLEELMDDRLKVAAHTEGFENRKADREQRNERQQCRIDKSHRPQIDLTPEQVAYDRVGVAQHAQGGGSDASALRLRAEEQPIE